MRSTRLNSDDSPNAYEKVVDRLLASPRLGERLATRWLNAARYADTNGYQTDAPRFMWRWRDWVIEAYNRNLPFDRFTIEQLAGDMLPGATLDQKIATGFNRNHRGNGEGGIIPEEYAVEYVVDRVDTTATVWLGLTLACARCHSHKFDPIGQEEFYRFFALFNNVPEEGRAIKYGNSPPLIKAPTRRAASRRCGSSRTRRPRSSPAGSGSRGRRSPPAQAAWEKIRERRGSRARLDARARTWSLDRRGDESRSVADLGDVAGLRLLRQVHDQRLGQARWSARTARLFRGWSTSRRARVSASCSSAARCKSTWSSGGSTTRSASRRRNALPLRTSGRTSR